MYLANMTECDYLCIGLSIYSFTQLLFLQLIHNLFTRQRVERQIERYGVYSFQQKYLKYTTRLNDTGMKCAQLKEKQQI